MECPYCKEPGYGAVELCAGCGFSLGEAKRLFGVPAALHPGVSDQDALFSKKAIRTLTSAVKTFERKFPQSQFSVVTSRNPSARMPLRVYAFWVFNMSGICKGLNKGGLNHDLLLMIDNEKGEASLTIGYGLEPFIPTGKLDKILANAGTDLADGDHLNACLGVIAETEKTLASVCAEMNETFGIDVQKIYEAEKERVGESERVGEY